MGRARENNIFLLCVIMVLIGGICSLHCPRYVKHEALSKGFLNRRAICRAANYGLEDKICLNGIMSQGFYCSTGSCNIFGYFCDGHCLTGDDNNDQDDNDFKCDEETIYREREKLCEYYRVQLDNHNKYMDEMRVPLDAFVIPPGIARISSANLYLLLQSVFIQQNVNSTCPVMGWAVSEM